MALTVVSLTSEAGVHKAARAAGTHSVALIVRLHFVIGARAMQQRAARLKGTAIGAV